MVLTDLTNPDDLRLQLARLQDLPNNWIEIPDFGVKPSDVSSEGFAVPILGPDNKGFEFRVLIYQNVVTARMMGMRHFDSLTKLRAHFAEVLDSYDGKDALALNSFPHVTAFLYTAVMASAARALKHATSDDEGSAQRCLLELCSCAELFRLWMFPPKEYTEFRDFRAVLKQMATKGALAKLANDPKQQEKQQVKECWLAWQAQPARYRSNAAFARDMLAKYESLQSQPVIERWCREWISGKKVLS